MLEGDRILRVGTNEADLRMLYVHSILVVSYIRLAVCFGSRFPAIRKFFIIELRYAIELLNKLS